MLFICRVVYTLQEPDIGLCVCERESCFPCFHFYGAQNVGVTECRCHSIISQLSSHYSQAHSQRSLSLPLSLSRGLLCLHYMLLLMTGCQRLINHHNTSCSDNKRASNTTLNLLQQQSGELQELLRGITTRTTCCCLGALIVRRRLSAVYTFKLLQGIYISEIRYITVCFVVLKLESG